MVDRASASTPGKVARTMPCPGSGVTGWQVGDDVRALLTGGGYAQKAARARELGAETAVGYRTEDFTEYGPMT